MRLLVEYLFIFIISNAACSLMYQNEVDSEQSEMKFIAKLIKSNWKPNGWQTILFLGYFPDLIYVYLQDLGTFVTVVHQGEDINYEKEPTNYYPNTVLINCTDFNEFEKWMFKVKESYYFHYHSNFIIYYHSHEEDITLAKMFYILWYQKLSNSIILMYNKDVEAFMIYTYNPYSNDKYKSEKNFGCSTVEKIGFTVTNLTTEFKCEPECDNVTLHSILRAAYFGTCIGYNIYRIDIHNHEPLETLNLFVDRSLNLHGMTLRAHATDVVPFLRISDSANDTYTIHSRDGMLWNTLAEEMNFTIDLSPSKKQMRKKFDFELNIKQIFDMSLRRVDLFLIPIYLMDVTLMPIEYTYPYKESGVCFIAKRAEYQNIFAVFQSHNIMGIIQFSTCILALWFGLFLYSSVERKPTYEQAGRDFLNAIRSVLTIPLHNPPKVKHIRLMFVFTFWGFFIITFALQASIISLFSANKRGVEVETFHDIIEKGYPIIGMSSPDLFLPETEEVYRKITAKLTPINNMYDCIDKMENNSKIFCLMECSMARYMEKNKLNSKGRQFLHVAKDRVHNMYLALILSLYSPLKYRIIELLMRLFEAGLISKWEEYKITNLVEDTTFKPLALKDLEAIFQIYGITVSFILVVFFGEISLSLLCRCLK